ncbi:MAG: hypothetical protein ACAI35_23345 [Candidatus Methylacidiphilales bacterium]|nr:hypothetical protein [Candidatus Methylacidiphilales bacterium]
MNEEIDLEAYKTAYRNRGCYFWNDRLAEFWQEYGGKTFVTPEGISIRFCSPDAVAQENTRIVVPLLSEQLRSKVALVGFYGSDTSLYITNSGDLFGFTNWKAVKWSKDQGWRVSTPLMISGVQWKEKQVIRYKPAEPFWQFLDQAGKLLAAQYGESKVYKRLMEYFAMYRRSYHLSRDFTQFLLTDDVPRQEALAVIRELDELAKEYPEVQQTLEELRNRDDSAVLDKYRRAYENLPQSFWNNELEQFLKNYGGKIYFKERRSPVVFNTAEVIERIDDDYTYNCARSLSSYLGEKVVLVGSRDDIYAEAYLTESGRFYALSDGLILEWEDNINWRTSVPLFLEDRETRRVGVVYEGKTDAFSVFLSKALELVDDPYTDDMARALSHFYIQYAEECTSSRDYAQFLLKTCGDQEETLNYIRKLKELELKYPF